MTPPNEFLPGRYHLEIYPDEIINGPIYTAQAKYPFPVPSVGDLINMRSFDQDEVHTVWARVLNVYHIYWTIEDSHTAHKLMFTVTAAELD